MKSTHLLRGLLSAVAAFVVAHAVHAQGTFVVLSKAGEFVQTGPTTTVPATPNAFLFSAEIDGTPTTPTPPNTFTLPNNGGTRSLAYVAADEMWAFEQGFASQAAMTVAYPNGTYSFAFGGRTVSVPFNGDLYPNTPVATLSAGTFNANGQLVVDRAVPLTITINFTQNFLAGSSRLAIEVFGPPSVNLGTSTDSTGFNQNTLTFTVPANTLAAGQPYSIELTANRIVTLDSSSAPGFTVVATYTSRSRINMMTAGGAGGGPVFSQQPVPTTAAIGGTATFTAQVANPAGVTFQWRRTGVNIPGQTNSTLTLTNVQQSDFTTYSVLATNAGGSTVSNIISLNPIAAGAPVFTVQPQSWTISPGSTVILNVVATGANGFVWRRDGAVVPNASGPTLVLSGAGALAGSYTATASNANGAVTSSPAVITVATGPDTGRLVNLAIRTNAGTGAQTLIVGFAVGGAGTSGEKPLLLRGIGPSLTQFGLTGVLADPVATVFQGSTTIATNDDWAGNAQVQARATQVAAFGLASNASLDAALASSPLPGSYSVQITGKNNGTGIALAEIYDASPGAPTPATPRLVNVSARTQVGTGGDVLIAGFVIGGTTARTVLIRAIGPTLSAFGVTGTLVDPRLQLFSGATIVRENDNWNGDQLLTSIGTSVGAFALSDPQSRDAILLTTLAPGSYTAQVSGVNNTTGVALVELYEVP